MDKHRQIGNAVPPPLGAAIGREIAKVLILNEQVKDENNTDSEKTFQTNETNGSLKMEVKVENLINWFKE